MNPFGPACEHQHWFPICYRVQLVTDGSGRVVRSVCRRGRKGGEPCGQAASGKHACGHIELAMKHLAGKLEPRERGRVEVSNITHNPEGFRPGSIRCPNCRQTWCVSPAGNAGAYECRSPVCMRKDKRGREKPWRFRPGTDERPKGSRRHEWPLLRQR